MPEAPALSSYTAPCGGDRGATLWGDRGRHVARRQGGDRGDSTNRRCALSKVSNINQNQWMDRKDMCELLGVTPRTVQRRVDCGDLERRGDPPEYRVKNLDYLAERIEATGGDIEGDKGGDDRGATSPSDVALELLRQLQEKDDRLILAYDRIVQLERELAEWSTEAQHWYDLYEREKRKK